MPAPDRHPPMIDYCGLTVIISNPSRFDTKELISGQAGQYFQHCLGNEINRHSCDIRTIDCKDKILDGTKVILLMGFRALEYLNKQNEATLSQLRGSPYLVNNIWHIATYHPQDVIDRKNYEAKLNTYIIEHSEQDEESEDETGSGSEDEGNKVIRRALRRAGYLTRDAREVDRKKVGKAKARKAKQYSKR